MSKTGAIYVEKDSFFHSLDGSIKLVMLILWTVFIFMFMDARIFTVMIILGFIMLKVAKIPYKYIKPLLIFIVIFTIFNSLLLILITPQYGSELCGRYTPVFTLYKFKLTYETLFYALTLSLKYISILPITMLFLFTTHPSTFASSLNRLGVSYKIAYAISIALRYIPDVNDELKNIVNAQEARGVAFKKGDAGIIKRVKNYVTVLLPLLISSLNRVEIVSNAMDLRGFGRYKKRTWYSRKNFTTKDLLFLILSVLLIVLGYYLKNNVSKGYWCI